MCKKSCDSSEPSHLQSDIKLVCQTLFADDCANCIVCGTGWCSRRRCRWRGTVVCRCIVLTSSLQVACWCLGCSACIIVCTSLHTGRTKGVSRACGCTSDAFAVALGKWNRVQICSIVSITTVLFIQRYHQLSEILTSLVNKHDTYSAYTVPSHRGGITKA